MSPVCENFIRAVLSQTWRDAYSNLNGLNMYEMLRALAALDPLDLQDLWAQRNNFTGLVNMPRIEYTYNIVQNRRLPQTAPGDLQQTGQVGDASNFLARPTPLTFEHDLTGRLPADNPRAARLGEQDFVRAAQGLGVEVAAIMAVAQVEAGGRVGFQNGRPIIRYELHIFHRRTGGRYDRTHPHLSQPTLQAGNRYHNGLQANEYSLLHGAMILRDPNQNRLASDAWQAASWGMFQVMGFNFLMVGWPSIDQFVQDMYQSEGQHLRAFLGYVRANRLGIHIVNHDWAAFAQGYNGAGYVVNHYDTNMANAFQRISAQRRRQHLPP